jgi:restriction endonuclease Mrr
MFCTRKRQTCKNRWHYEKENIVAIPDFQTLMLLALKLGATGEIRLRDSIDIHSDEFNFDEQDREQMLPTGNMTTMRSLALQEVCKGAVLG